jgi:hypothetical protein
MTQGYGVWWDSTGEKAYNAPAAGRYFLGFAAKSSGATDTTCEVILAPFTSEGHRILTVAATGGADLVAADFMSGELTVIAPNTAAESITIPAIATLPIGCILHVYKSTSDAYAATLDPYSSEQIDGGNTFTLIDAQYDRATFQSTGSAWIKIDYEIS